MRLSSYLELQLLNVLIYSRAENHPKLYLWSKPWQKRSLPEKSEVKTEFQEPDDELPEFPTLNSLMDEQMPKIPQPEAVIDLADCKLNLLDHIAHSQNLVEERLSNFEVEIDRLDESVEQNPEDFVHTKQAMQLLLRDLTMLTELNQGNYL